MTGNKTKGFTLFFAVLVASLAMAVGLAIYDLTIREIQLSVAARESQYAIYAADTGVECAMYWNYKYTGSTGSNCITNAGVTTCTSAFVSGTGDTTPGSGTIFCNGQDITAASSNNNNNTPTNSDTGWAVTKTDATHATTEFWISLGVTAQSPCAQVTVIKFDNPVSTDIKTHGYNTCAAGALQFEREFEVKDY